MRASVLPVQKLQRSSGAESETRIVKALLQARSSGVGYSLCSW